MLKNYIKIALRNLIIVLGILLMLFGLSCSQSNSQDEKEKRDITKEFSGVKTVDISTVSGNCQIMRGDSLLVKVTLTHHYIPAGTFEPIFEQEDDVLKLRENMLGSNSGSSDWILLVPEQTNVIFGSASGSILIKDVIGKIIVHTASGAISATDIKILESSEFTSASGNVNVRFSESPLYGVLVSSASGVASIDFNNNPIVGTLEMKSRNDKGEIHCPLKFDTEKEEFKNNQAYIVKKVIVKQETPVIKIYTASGTAALKN